MARSGRVQWLGGCANTTDCKRIFVRDCLALGSQVLRLEDVLQSTLSRWPDPNRSAPTVPMCTAFTFGRLSQPEHSETFRFLAVSNGGVAVVRFNLTTQASVRR